ncbi:hypothetical protein LOK49_LG14G02233 [Camellia lanceoleosa]|uniref:Uncharacterized protein n=1 Tax=Camellia lanceoleosa TaxID=1840588 RepID=A0ACC0FCX4_9ERIC|nr:hypothetical protein LOK49_LG14G02233 [Camellia lanceoleosa]
MVSMRSVEDDHQRIRSIVKDLVTDTSLHYPSIDLLKLLIWNCRDVGNNTFKRNLVEIIRVHKPEILILMETKDTSHVNVRASSVSSQAIHATVHKEDYEEWVLAAVYASPNPSLKDTMWDDLESVAQNMKKRWMVAGDFNDYGSQNERKTSLQIITPEESRNFLIG